MICLQGNSTFSPHNEQPDTAEAWSEVESRIQQYNDDTISHALDDLNILFVFVRALNLSHCCLFIANQVGLFSAVVSAFLMASYQLLQEDPADVSARVLVVISQQLGNISVQSGSLGVASSPTSTVSPFKPSKTALAINILWFSCLITSIGISMHILAQRSHLRGTAYQLRLAGISPPPPNKKHSHTFRLLRQTAAFETSNNLPLLLVYSIFCFFVGLALFVIRLNWVVAIIAILLAEVPRWLGTSIIFLTRAINEQRRQPSQPFSTFSEAAVHQQREWSMSILTSFELFVGSGSRKYRKLIRRCLAEASIEDVYRYLRRILPDRAYQPWIRLDSLKRVPSRILDHLPRGMLIEAVEVVADAVERLLDDPEHGGKWSEVHEEGVSFLTYIDPKSEVERIPEVLEKLVSKSPEMVAGLVSTLVETGWKHSITASTPEGIVHRPFLLARG